MSNIINFKVEKLLTPQGTLSGYFVVATNAEAVVNPFAGMMEMLGENVGEKWKDSKKQEQKFFFPTEKEVMDYIAYQLNEFKDKS